MGVKGKERNKMMNKNSVSSLINFIQLVCVFYRFTGSPHNPHSLSQSQNSSHFMKKETKAQWPWQKLLQLLSFTSNKLKQFVQVHSESG